MCTKQVLNKLGLERLLVIKNKVILVLVVLMCALPSYAAVKSVSIARDIVGVKGISSKGIDVSCTNTKTKYLVTRAKNEKQWCYQDGKLCAPKKIQLAEKLCSNAMVRKGKSKEEFIKPTGPVAISDYENERKLQDELLDIQQEIIDIKEKLVVLRKQEITLRSTDL